MVEAPEGGPSDASTASPDASDPPEEEIFPERRAGGPTILRITLGGQLRRLREARGISREDAGHEIRASEAKISRLELGQVGFKQRDLVDLLTLYGITDVEEREALLHLGRLANERGWWRSYGEVIPSWFETYIGLEQAATLIRSYEPQFVPGLLQTEDYARAVVAMDYPAIDSAEVERRVQLRLQRHTVLTEPAPPMLWVVLDEGALRRPIGGTKVQLDQLRRLVELAELPNVTMQVALFSSGGHAAAGGAFSILRFSDPAVPDVVYMEQLTSAVYLDKKSDVEFYATIMSTLAVQAADPATTVRTLHAMINE